ncbi:hypothetical protein BKA70DRAFT_1285968 [Coprinopsis sp. MPI-PUGE-AT-0042]|nr:hypothetical protein BKA70DRAFT_1285968 [Coprinopsis sp. MPI-PUGE-AT-0042]
MLTKLLELIPFTLTNEEAPEDLIPLCQQGLKEAETVLEETRNQEPEPEVKGEMERGGIEGLQNLKTTYSALLSPLRRFPNELIAKLIWHCLGEHDTLLDASDRGAFRALRCVCRRWRNIAFSTPEFWRGVSVDWSQTFTSGLAQTLGQWFDRGGPHAPLKLALCDIINITTEDLEALLLDSHRRWVELSLDLEPSAFRTLLNGIQDDEAIWSHVQQLGLGPTRGSILRPSGLVCALMDPQNPRLPVLHRLRLREMIPGNHMPHTLYHANLSVLHLSDCILGAEMTQSLFSPACFPRLQEVIIVNTPQESSVPVPQPVTRTVHPGVRRAIIMGTSVFLMPYLSFPDLQYLHTNDIDNELLSTELSGFLQQSGANLHSLCSGSTPRALAAHINYLPCVKRLYVEDLGVFEHLSYAKGGPLASLQILIWNNQNPRTTQATSDAFLRFVSQREVDEQTPLVLKVLHYQQVEKISTLRHLQECDRLKIELVSRGDFSWMYPDENCM